MENSEQDELLNNFLDSLQGMERAETPPFFYTRLQARMQKEQKLSWGDKLVGLLAKPSFTIATLSVFILLNVVAINAVLHQKKINVGNQSTNESTMQGFMQEYDLSVSTVYSDTKQ